MHQTDALTDGLTDGQGAAMTFKAKRTDPRPVWHPSSKPTCGSHARTPTEQKYARRRRATEGRPFKRRSPRNASQGVPCGTRYGVYRPAAYSQPPDDGSGTGVSLRSDALTEDGPCSALLWSVALLRRCGFIPSSSSGSATAGREPRPPPPLIGSQKNQNQNYFLLQFIVQVNRQKSSVPRAT